jgi:hypothetical protein
MEQTRHLLAKVHCSCPGCRGPVLIHGLLASTELGVGVPANSLAGAQGRLQLVEGRAECWQKREAAKRKPGPDN